MYYGLHHYSASGALSGSRHNNGNGQWPGEGKQSGHPGTIEFDASRSARTSSETRPKNVALLACIRY